MRFSQEARKTGPARVWPIVLVALVALLGTATPCLAGESGSGPDAGDDKPLGGIFILFWAIAFVG